MQHHFLEDRASASVRGAIERHADAVWSGLRVKLNCLEASLWWHKAFQVDGVPSQLHGRVGGTERGGYLSTKSSIDNHGFVVVGGERALFDPTHSQLLDDPPWDLNRYIMADGRAFPTWREVEDLVGPMAFVPPLPQRARPWTRSI